MSPSDLERLVSRVALYPDPLLAEVLAASTYPDQIAAAYAWSDSHHYLSGEALAAAIVADNVPWDPSVQALLPFPYVLEHMAADMPWTSEIGTAYMAHPNELLDAVQRMRRLSTDFGYLVRNKQVNIVPFPAYILIMPTVAKPDVIAVPIYSTGVVFLAPAMGGGSSSAIRYTLTENVSAFAAWGWPGTRIAWDKHAVMIAGAPFQHFWNNRTDYVHVFPDLHRDPKAAAQEKHELIPRTDAEKRTWEDGRSHAEDHTDKAADKKPEHP